jgi:O-antigen/teichoic acid export membrane protein
MNGAAKPTKGNESNRASRGRKSVVRLGIQGALGVLDQGVFSGANFVSGVLLARWLAPAEFGAYALAFAALLISYQLHQSMITDPMGVLGPANYSGQLRTYLLVQLRMHFATTVPLSLVVGAAFSLATRFLEGNAALVTRVLAVMTLSLPLVLLPWFLRRAFYVLRLPQASVLGSVIYAAMVLGTLLTLRTVNLLRATTAILSLAVAGLVTGLFLGAALLAVRKEGRPLDFWRVFGENWAYARWLVAAAAFMVIAGQMQVFVAGRLLGITAAGVVNVLQSFSQPMILTIGAICAIAMPYLSADHERRDLAGLRRKVRGLILVMLALSLSFEGVLIFFGGTLEHFLYGGKYSAHAGLIPYFGLVPVLLSLYWGTATGLQAAQKSQAILIVSFIWLPISLGLGYGLISASGLHGAAAAAILGYGTIVVVCWVLYAKWIGLS